MFAPLVLVAICLGQPTELQKAYAHASVRVSNVLPTHTSHGSGTIIRVTGDKALVLTCGHLFREGVGRIAVYREEGEPRLHGYEANFLASAVGADLAAVQIRARAGMKSITFSRGNEQQAWMFGWGHNQQASVEGRYVGTCTRDGDRDPDFRFLFRSRDGDSGGGVWDRHGRLIGVVWGDDPYGSVVVSTSKVEAFLATNERCFRFFRRPQAVINVSYSQGVVATPPVFPSESPLAVLGESAPPPPEIQQTPPLPSKVIPPAATHLPSPQIPSKTAPAPQSNGVGLAQAFEIPVTLQVEIRARIGDAIRAAVQAR